MVPQHDSTLNYPPNLPCSIAIERATLPGVGGWDREAGAGGEGNRPSSQREQFPTRENQDIPGIPDIRSGSGLSAVR